MREGDIGHLAGFIDGDGSISLNMHSGSPYPHIAATNINRPFLKQLQGLFGGNLSKTSNNKAFGRRQLYVLSWRGWKNCKRILYLIKPFIKLKRPQALLLLSLPNAKLGYGAKIKNKIIWQAHRRMRVLNSRGGKSHSS